jgi:O-methyltransferase
MPVVILKKIIGRLRNNNLYMKIIINRILQKLSLQSKSDKFQLFFKYKELSNFLPEEFYLFDQKANDLYKKYKIFTMIPYHQFYENLLLCELYKNKIKGSIVECGAWRGGMIASLVEILGNTQQFYVFDSFEGLPEATEIDGEAAIQWQNDKAGAMYFDNCKAEIEYAESAMKLANAQNYKLVKGWFSETLPNYNISEGIGILRLDSDWYDSTITCLNHLYPLVNKGGLIIIDDYYTWDGCSKAIHDYLSANKLTERIFSTPGNVAYIIKN